MHALRTKRINKFLKTILCATSLLAASSLPAQAQDNKFSMPEWNKYQYGNHSIRMHGYFRTSKGWDTEGNDVMTVFSAPGAQSRFRLGNESDSNIEVGLDYRYHIDDPAMKNGRWIQLLGMISDYESNPNYGDLELIFEEETNPQSFVRLGNILGDDMNIWFGRRYYDRRDIHMTDHFWLNVAQGAEMGGGIEGLPVGNHKMDIAVFKNEDDGVTDRTGTTTAQKNLNSYTLDVRYRDIPTWDNGALTLWGLYAHRPRVNKIAYDTENGIGLGGWHTQQNILSGRMVTGFAYRQGTALQQGLFNSKSVREDQGYDLDEAYSVEINNDLLIEPSDDYAMQWSTIIRREKRGIDASGGGDTIDWISTGVRPVYFINDYFSIATELGVDYVDNEIVGVEGFLGKGTVALQLTKERGYFARPMLKLFATGATWSDDFKGHVGNGTPGKATSFADDTSGLTAGIQFEVWW